MFGLLLDERGKERRDTAIDVKEAAWSLFNPQLRSELGGLDMDLATETLQPLHVR